MALKVKIVDGLTATVAGSLIETMPVLPVDGPATIPGGHLLDAIEMEEADDGVPIRIVDEAIVLNSVGNPVEATPGKGVGYSFEHQEARDFVARWPVQPSNTRKLLVDTLFDDIKAANVLSDMDALWLLDGPDSGAALLNAVSDTFNPTAVNAPAFTADRGYAGNGSSSYLNTGFNLAAGGHKASQNSNFAAVWVNTDTLAGSTELGGSDFSLSANRNTGNAGARNANTGPDSFTGPGASSAGLLAMVRNNSSNYDIYYNGVFVTTITKASSAFVSQELFILARNNGSGALGVGSTRQVRYAMVGQAIDATKMLGLYNALNAYAVAVGTG